MELTLIIVLVLLVAGQQLLHFLERKDMLDRLMAKNLPEYKDHTTVEENDIEPQDDGTVEMEEARDLVYGEEE